MEIGKTDFHTEQEYVSIQTVQYMMASGGMGNLTVLEERIMLMVLITVVIGNMVKLGVKELECLLIKLYLWANGKEVKFYSVKLLSSIQMM